MESAHRTLWIYDRIVIQNLSFTIKELAEEFNVSTRTINRTLSTINKFIYPKRIRKEENGNVLELVTLTEDEMY